MYASSDLAVNGEVQGAKDTGKTGEVNYAIGSTKGACMREASYVGRG